jgi:hypothetical protein
MSALERRDLKIDMITHLEMEFTAATIDVHLLTGLSNAKIFANDLDLVLASFTKSGPKKGLSPDSDQLIGIRHRHP